MSAAALQHQEGLARSERHGVGLRGAERIQRAVHEAGPGRAAPRRCWVRDEGCGAGKPSQALSASPRRAALAPPRPVTRHACACATAGTPPQEPVGSSIGAPRPLAAREDLAERGGAPEVLVPSSLTDLGS